jgi:hypothetical protein
MNLGFDIIVKIISLEYEKIKFFKFIFDIKTL